MADMFLELWKDSQKGKELAEHALRRNCAAPKAANITPFKFKEEAKPVAQNEKDGLGHLTAAAGSVDNLDNLKLRARSERTGEFRSQRHWFNEDRVVALCAVNPPKETSLPPVDKQSRLDAILDLLTLGSTHYSNGR